MEENIKISIIVPVYNVEKYLEKCLNSIINQSLREIEIIVVNDCSSDNSLEIIKKYMKLDKRIILIDKIKNEGVSEARNSAIEISRGEYILNIDSDDWIEQDYFFDMYEKAKKQELDILISDIILSYEDKTTKILKDLSIKDDEILSGEEYLNIFFSNNLYGFTWNKLIKANLYRETNIRYNKNRKFIEDVELLGQMILYCKRIGKLNKSYYNYRQGDNNSSHKKNIKNLNDLYDGLDILIRLYEEKEMFDLSKLVKRVRNMLVVPIIFDKEYKKLENYNEFLRKYIYSLDNEKYIIFISRKEKYISFKRCVAYNIIKILSSLNKNLTIKFLV